MNLCRLPFRKYLWTNMLWSNCRGRTFSRLGVTYYLFPSHFMLRSKITNEELMALLPRVGRTKRLISSVSFVSESPQVSDLLQKSLGNCFGFPIRKLWV